MSKVRKSSKAIQGHIIKNLGRRFGLCYLNFNNCFIQKTQEIQINYYS